ncbi:MAG: InlB B-repeat-containing protein [Herbinix sp.]|jgi:hypothetical protein|nr:InlB B-repeat-containing protein [Herbinix sp.]
MKKGKFRIILFLSILASVFILTACNKPEGTTEPEVTGSPENNVEETMYTVVFYDMDGTTELSTEKVKAGEVVKEYIPEKDGSIFMGWFATPSLSHAYDFTAPIAADTKIFAGFLENQEDTRSFAIVGSGKSPLLVTSSWGTVINDEHMLVKEEGKNVYSITLDLYEGDEFQLVIDTSWRNQRGAGYLTTTSQDGVEYLASSAGNYQSGSAKKANIKCLVTGSYTLTLTTYPGADTYDTADSGYSEEAKENFNLNPYDTIAWVYNGEPQAAVAENLTNYYIKSSITTEWKDLYEDKYRFVEVDGLPTLTIDLAEGEEFLFTSTVKVGDTENVGNEYIRYTNIKENKSLELMDSSDSYNMIAKATGTYTFVYNPETTELTIAFEAK